MAKDEFYNRVKAFFEEKERIDSESKQFEQNKKAFYKYVNENQEEKEAIISSSEANSSSYRVSKVYKSSINYNVEIAKEILTKEEYKKIINREFVIDDYSGFLSFLKSKGISSSELKKFMHISDSVNPIKLENEEALGNVTHKQVNTIKDTVSNFSYVTVKKMD